MIGMTAEEYHRQVADTMTEAALLAQVTALARGYGWLAYHTHRSDRSPAGFPDLCLVHPRAGRIVFAELKRQRKSAKPTAAQVEWLDAINVVSDSIATDLADASLWSEVAVADPPTRVIAVLWRPLDLLNGIVEGMLRVSQ